MKILWLDINSSYSHSSVALPAIHAQVQEKAEGWEWCVVRGTINDNPGALAAEVAELEPDVVAATFWLFTHNMQLEVLSRVAALLEEVRIVCGGPEFLGDNEDFLRRNTFVSAVIRGEGEEALPQWLGAIGDESRWEAIRGLCWISEAEDGDSRGAYHDNGTARVEDFASLRYPEESRFFNWDKPFVQLETTRGCFNTCTFCVSGGEKPVRYQSLEQVRDRLKNIYSHGIKDVRVLDRTFNYDTSRACRMLDTFEEYAGKMRFHLEIHPSLLSEPLKARLEYLCSQNNLETHADLIAGLPGYGLEALTADIVKLAGMKAGELQIESLKVLPGTVMRQNARSKGLKYSPLPPYEILQTPTMTPDELRRAMDISRMVDLYYNSGAWQAVTRELICEEAGFIAGFTSYLKNQMVLDSPVSLERRGVILYEYCKSNLPEKLSDVSAAWIEGGFSLKKEPAGGTVRVKHIEAFMEEHELLVKYGRPDSGHRYYLHTSGDRQTLFGYDSREHQPAPVFRAEVIPVLYPADRTE